MIEKHFDKKLKLFMFLISAASACFGPFLPVYFSSRNLTYTEIGIAFALNAAIGVIIQPLWGYISDKFLSKKKTLFIALSLNMISVFLFIEAKSFGAILGLIILNVIFMCALPPITDAYVFDLLEERKELSYSNFRFMSSAAWGITNLILGYVIKAFGIDYTFIIYDILSMGALIILILTKFEGKKNLNKIEFSDVKYLIKDKNLIVFFITIFLMNAAFIGGVNYMNELINFNHGDVTKLGTVWFVTCTFEVLTFFITTKLMNKFGLMRIYLVSIFLYGFKFILDYIFSSANLIIAVQVIEGVAFTLFITSSLEYLNLRTDSKVRSTAMSMYAAFGGFGAFSASLAGGVLLNIINPSQLFGILGLICGLAFGCVMYLMKYQIQD